MILFLPIGVMCIYFPVLMLASYLVCGFTTVLVLGNNHVFYKVISIQEHKLDGKLGALKSFWISIWASMIVIFTWISLDLNKVISDVNKEYDKLFGGD